MKDFSQEFYTWLLEQKEMNQNNLDEALTTYRAKPIMKEKYTKDIKLLINTINTVINKYKEICYREEK